MKNFLVTWSMEIAAKTAQEAANKVYAIHKDEAEEADLFEIQELDTKNKPLGDPQTVRAEEPPEHDPNWPESQRL